MSNIKLVKFIDRIASVFIKCGGIAVITCVALIVLMIFKVALPLFFSSNITLKAPPFELIEKDDLLEIGLGEYQDSFFTLTKNGKIKIYELSQKEKPIKEISLISEATPIFKLNHISKEIYAAHWLNGRSVFFRIYSKSILEMGVRKNKFTAEIIATIDIPYLSEPHEIAAAIDMDKGAITRVFADEKAITINFFKFESDETNANISEKGQEFQIENQLSGQTFLSLSANSEQLWVVKKSGFVSRYKLDSESGVEKKEELNIQKEVSAITGVFGDVSLVIAHTNGEVNSWMSVRPNIQVERKEIVKSHSLLNLTIPVIQLKPSFQDKTFLALTRNGDLYQSHLTTEKQFISLLNNQIRFFDLSPKANGLITMVGSKILIYSIHNPHHEVSFSILFSKIWYEGYSASEYVWQSGNGGDDGEAKLSLIPLIFGTLKGTFYAMLLSVPLALGSAIYISQFAAPTIRNYIKPTVEMMSAIPSVVVGFIAALWLAPKIDNNLLLVFLSLPFFMILFFLTLFIWSKFASDKIRKSAEHGFRLFYMVPAFLLTFCILYVFCPWLEGVFFQGSFKLKMIEFFSIKGYEQRNCIIIGFALGFTVIPIIFTIAEDVLSAVPRSLTANSLALGANRWQTVWRVILPSASPGIVAGVIIGFGRAIGETMIVMMATGNTPIIDASIFNGMRTLSANIAVEIGEAPVDGTLYRILFLSAVILFSMTFILNTGAEVIRQALRKKYSQF